MSHKRNIKLLLAFDGTRYAGWQKQKSMQTVQGVIEEKLRIMTGEELCLHGAGRTDAGVHAMGMVANYHTEANIPCQGFLKGLNSMLPPDIRVLEASEVEAAFHARIDAKAKTYWYNFNNSAIQLPTERLYAAHFFADLDFEAMRQGLEHLEGTHDFSSFEGAGSRDRKSSKRGAVRTIIEKYRWDSIGSWQRKTDTKRYCSNSCCKRQVCSRSDRSGRRSFSQRNFLFIK